MLKCVITGGPCAGKTEIMSYLTQILEERGYYVFICPESATELILNGIKPNENISVEDFQNFVLDKQLAKEALYDNIEKYYPSDKVVIFYDRGIFDACAYIDRLTFCNMLKKRNLSVFSAQERYDAVLHLRTTAIGAEEFYQWNDPTKEGTGNNAARSESPEEAREKDRKTLAGWLGHSHLRIFGNSTDFDGKVKMVVEEVFSLLGEPVPKEIERKFLIKKPSIEEIEKLGYISKSEIIQTYLNKKDNITERRIRQRGTNDNGYNFYYTEKTNIKNGIRYEKEEKISKDEYIRYLADADTSLHQIKKTRYCFVYDNRYFEMDLYPFSNEYAILEIELNDINEEINFPTLSIIKEVTNDNNYRNSQLAKTLSLKLKGKEYCENWIYESGKEILGSSKENVFITKDLDKAIDSLNELERNYLIRHKYENNEKIEQYYNIFSKIWVNN